MSPDKRAQIVLGLGFGDEGKGLTVDFLCGQALAAGRQPLVVRFNGGHQAGHTVVLADGRRHVFSSFGAGTLRGVPTYWSAYCTFSPASVLREYAALRALGVHPRLLVDGLCPVTTHYDVLYNRALEAGRGTARHGSCGVGFGATVARHQETPLRLYAQDLRFPAVFTYKLRQIRMYYEAKIKAETSFDFHQFDHDGEDQRFAGYATQLADLHQQQLIQLTRTQEIFASDAPWQTYVFEGAQGILLDMDFGLFPHVTRSRTTSANALDLLRESTPAFGAHPEIYYVSRAYHTRHGAGPFPPEAPINLVNNAAETNQPNDHQGNFRTGPLSVELLNYALTCDANFSAGLSKHFVLTCLDHLPNGQLPCFYQGHLQQLPPKQLPVLLETDFASYRFSHSSTGAGLNQPLAL
ncbi:adenylosuccinate synthetase [Hymenobacter sp. ASUV-10]|uniref:Adenylosuccinate synthetase n=1 Tax=Hymenobacter aranciens TaxID=3063996 RepID=A0ABT9B9B3_9BACT|nr:adenylosuccinate synthetase [Hymenobacter sp. ASUV-10]MDO7874859.1 adenylosuccinate synthetase [Hymenobacter sp. ASUV-10]